MFFPRSITIITVSTHNIFLERQGWEDVRTLLEFQKHYVKFNTVFICQLKFCQDKRSSVGLLEYPPPNTWRSERNASHQLVKNLTVRHCLSSDLSFVNQEDLPVSLNLTGMRSCTGLLVFLRVGLKL